MMRFASEMFHDVVMMPLFALIWISDIFAGLNACTCIFFMGNGY